MGAIYKLPAHAATDRLISAAVSALVAGRGLRREDVAAEIGVGRGAFYNKINGTAPWKASELVALAEFFRVPVTDLLDGLGGRVALSPVKTAEPRPADAGGASVRAARARRDSNSQPSDP